MGFNSGFKGLMGLCNF